MEAKDIELVLVKGTGNWADEFDLNGFFITTREIWERAKEKLKKANWPQECYYGTNEYVIYTSAKEFLRGCEVKGISFVTVQLFMHYLGREGQDQEDELSKLEKALAELKWDDESEEIPTLFEYGLFPLPLLGEE